ncbi:MAG: hypothetical protein OEW87_10060 [Flavobacteriaceae bacterium]|nr:hypothetical protein [Flavobacteriaceae bacterium]
MKVFEFKWEEDIDLVVADNMVEALFTYKKFTGNDLEFIAWFCNINEYPESKWKDYHFLDANEMEPDEDHDEDDYLNGYKIIETLEEYMKRQTETHVIE